MSHCMDAENLHRRLRKISVQLKQVHITQLHLFWVLHSA